MNILNSKLIGPQRRAILHRKRLTRLFAENTGKKVVTVIAGAGFGKTTLVVDALTRLNRTPVWYRLDEQDTDFHVFMAYLYTAVDQHDAGGGHQEGGEKWQISGIKDQTTLLMEWLAFAQARIQQPAAIILDDYHLVQPSQAVNEALDFLLPRLPDHIHLIIIGRQELPLALSRLRVTEKLVEITETDLCFSDREIEGFFDGRVSITPPEIRQILQTTKGWAASLVLLRYAFSKKPDASVSESLEKLQNSPDLVFAYLKETLFDAQPAATRDFMMKAALLPEIDARRCRRIFNAADAGRILKRMVENHLLIFPVDDSGNVFQLHHLFRDFLRKQLHEHYPAIDIARFHGRIAEELESHDIYLALDHFIKGERYERAIKIIETHEMDFLLRGNLNFLEHCLNRIPPAFIAEHPRLLLSQARICSHFGNSEKAIQLTSRALKLFERRKDRDQMVDCVIELGMQYYYTGHLKEAKLLLEQVLESIAPESPAYVIAMTFLTFLPSVLGEFETSRGYDRAARQTIAGYGEFERNLGTALLDTSLTHSLFFSGAFEYSQQLSQRLLKRVLALNLEPCLPLIYYQLSANCHYLGQWNDGCHHAREGIATCERMSLADSRKAWVYLAWAENLVGLGQFEAAKEKLDRSIELFENPGNRWGLASAWNCLADLYANLKQTAPALRILEEALHLIDGYGLTVTRGILENSMAGVLQAQGQASQSLARLSSARPRLTGASYHLFDNHLLAARAHDALDRTQKAVHHLAEALALAERFSFTRLVIEGRDWIIPLLARAREAHIAIPPATERYAADLWDAEIHPSPPLLTISLLGKFRLQVGSETISAAAWKSSKALMILKYLASHHDRGHIPKDVLIELLWPEQDPAKTGSRFNMAMSALRKTLQPELPPKAPSAYIDRKKDTYRINPERCRIDTQRFDSLVSRAQKAPPGSDQALGLYLEACDLYRGEFLAEDRYESWCLAHREACFRQYMAVLEALIAIFETRGDLQKAIAYAHKLLDNDPLNEEILIKLMHFYATSGAPSKITAAYETYADQAARADIPVSHDVASMYKDLVKI